VARAVVALSSRRNKPFISLNCAALPENLIESELFGHEKGAFTGASDTKPGQIELADTGTLFLDEIATLTLPLQTKLLRVLEDRQVQRLGGRQSRKIDFRLICATNEPLEEMARSGKFREDLYYRLNVINIALPPLRERREDIAALATHFFNHYCRENNKFLDMSGRSTLRFEPEALQVLMEHAWPGNVRELENVVERAVVLATDASVPLEVLPDALLEANGVRLLRSEGTPLPPNASLFEIVNDFERRIIMERLEQCGWSQTDAAESLSVPLSTLNQKIKRLDIKIRKKGET